ncbi:hypothetical protein COD21_02265 [Bacillus cereus]|uniref:hypothetical protein n=1 Tax=Bacillus cereus TaxID=1396 RepID=UPI000BFC7F86|nr:hypothetical protein [Bacillus cereus]PGU13415.1 hypothetical protein COD21_02265 [Bacillus cereus]
MIRLERPSCPPMLLLKKAELTEEYKLTKKAVWKKSFIKKPLLEMSHGKCCFCECKLVEEGKYMQVEHFHHKDDYKDEVVDWDNLLPICMRCNTHKGSHDTYENEIINPTVRDPQEHLYLSIYRIKGKDELGKLTIEVLDLNDAEEILVPRMKIANAFIEKIEETLHLAESYNTETGTDVEKARIVRKIRSILKQCTAKYVYSAVAATVILSYHLYDKLKSVLISKQLWTSDIQAFEDAAKTVRFDVEP